MTDHTDLIQRLREQGDRESFAYICRIVMAARQGADVIAALTKELAAAYEQNNHKAAAIDRMLNQLGQQDEDKHNLTARIAELEAQAKLTPSQFHEAMVAADKLGYQRAIRDAAVWQPIETAPKDGTEILCLLRPKVVRLCWFFARSSQTFGFMDECGKDVEPTHWMPLPPAPQEGE